MNFEPSLADRTRHIRANAIREILKVIAQPNMISLAGGLPAPESFPLETIAKLSKIVIDKYASSAFQYAPTEGLEPLRAALADYLQTQNMQVTPDDVYIASGSQGLLDQIGKIMISKGDLVAVEAPTYLGALQAFNSYEPQYVCLQTDDLGLIPESLEEVLRQHRIKFVYLVPTFQNPSGRTIPLERRQQIADIIKQHNTLLVEDDPYSALRYEGTPLPPIQTLAPEHTIYTSTFSKILAPGLRIGFYVAPPTIKKWLILAKQGIDLHSNTFSQAIAAEYLSGGYLKKQLPKIIRLYRPRQKAMLESLENYFPADFKWSRPEGGMFIWVEGPQGFDAEDLYYQAVKQKVAYVPGKFFYTRQGQGLATMRLNFSMCDVATLQKGIKILSDVIKANL